MKKEKKDNLFCITEWAEYTYEDPNTGEKIRCKIPVTFTNA